MNRRLLLAAATAIFLATGRTLAVCVPSASQVCYSGGVAVNIGPTTGNLIPWFNGLHIFSPTTGQSNLYLDHNSAAGSSVYLETNTGTRSCTPWDTGSCTLDFQIQDNGAGVLNYNYQSSTVFQITSAGLVLRAPLTAGSGGTISAQTSNGAPTGETAGQIYYDTSAHTFNYAAAPGPTWTPLLTAATLPAPTSSVLGGVFSGSCATNQFGTGISTAGSQTCAQPSFGNLSGTAAASQLPNPTTSALGGIEAILAVAHKVISAISTAGVAALTQLASSDLSDYVAPGACGGSFTPAISGVTVPTAGGSITASSVTCEQTAAGGQNDIDIGMTITAAATGAITGGSGTLLISEPVSQNSGMGEVICPSDITSNASTTYPGGNGYTAGIIPAGNSNIKLNTWKGSTGNSALWTGVNMFIASSTVVYTLNLHCHIDH